jgi:hypothetical protein
MCHSTNLPLVCSTRRRGVRHLSGNNHRRTGRFVKGTAALLGFTRFADTCVLELDGIRGLVEGYFDTVLAELEKANIPFALHWGKATD